MGLFFYTKISSIISIGDLPTTNIIEPQENGMWYFYNTDGSMATGWVQVNSSWYYLNSNGSMKVNQWFQVGGKWYYVNASGELAVNTSIDGYRVNDNGEWVR
ncbi:choline binding protein [Streptococcus pneumoniae]|nr:choline binding protein [Streptococcus pneumoniae]